MRILDRLHFAGEDPRVRRYLLPTRIVWQQGDIRGAEQLLQQQSVQIAIQKTAPITMKNGEDGLKASVVLDFGVEMNGGIRILSADSAQWRELRHIRLVFGESVAEAMGEIGQKCATNDHAMRDMEVGIPFASDQEFGQMGFRFVRIELVEPNAELRLKSIMAVFVYRELEYLGDFSCDDNRLCEIYNTAAYTCHLNMQTMLWDGIKRDRLVWVGDMHPEMLTIRSVFGAHPIVEESMNFAMGEVEPPKWMNGMPTYSMWLVLVMWDWYWYTGNLSFLKQRHAYIISLLQQLESLVDENGADHIPEYFLDWPTRDKPAAVSGGRSLLRMALKTGARVAALLKDTALADTCEQKFERMTAKTEEHGGFKQVAAFQVLSGVANIHDVAELLKKDGAHGLSTYLCYYTLSVLAEGGCRDEAIAQLRDYFGAMLDCGATTFWEDFDLDWTKTPGRIDEPVPDGGYDLHGDNGQHCYIGHRHSLCHGWASGPVPFLVEQVLGIRIVEPGCRQIEIAPHLGRLQWAKGAFPTPHGVLHISHQKRPDGSVDTKIEAPNGVRVILK